MPWRSAATTTAGGNTRWRLHGPRAAGPRYQHAVNISSHEMRAAFHAYTWQFAPETWAPPTAFTAVTVTPGACGQGRCHRHEQI